MTWPFWRPVADRLSAVLSEPSRVVPAEAEVSGAAAGEEFRPSVEELVSVQGTLPVKIKVPYAFTPEDEAAEDRVLAGLATLTAVMPPWQAADQMFNTIGDSDDVA